jgi:hypothetical protein
LIGYANVPRAIATIISADKATLVELQSALGVEDAYDLLEIISVDNYNLRQRQPKP